MSVNERTLVICSSLALVISACTARSVTAVDGSVRGQSFTGTAADFDTLGNGGFLIAIADAGGVCQYASANGGGVPPSLDIRWLSILTCGGPTDVTGDYDVKPDFQATSDPCEVKAAGAEMRQFVGGVVSQIPADSGTLTISASSDQGLKGSLTLNFGTEAIAGEFSAAFCASLNH